VTGPSPANGTLAAHPAARRKKLLWVATLYVASGFPFSFLNEILPVYFREGGVSLADIGLLSLATLPYTFKFLWAPLVDRLGTRRHWVLGCQLAIAAAMIALATTGGGAVTPVLWVTLLAIATLSATQDVAVDAYTIEQLEPRERGPANGLRVTAYRLALIAGGGLLLAASGRLGWPNLCRVAGGTMLLLAGITLLMPSTARAPAAGRDPVWEPLRRLLTLPAAWAVALFVLTFKLGDLALQPMIRPFWVDAGYTPAQIGTVVSTVGTGATIVGALAGGLLTARLGTFRALWMLGLVQALSNLGYYAAAVAGAPAPLLYTAAVIEQFATGLGTAAFLTFLMSLCDRRYAATQYALLSALYRVGGVVAGSISGFAAERMGYGTYFLFTFALAFPAFLLLPQVRRAPLADGVTVTD
jgi:PAT family beta-lactamase induction signal transducer AmpG